jgi:hypothetical protein
MQIHDKILHDLKAKVSPLPLVYPVVLAVFRFVQLYCG